MTTEEAERLGKPYYMYNGKPVAIFDADEAKKKGLECLAGDGAGHELVALEALTSESWENDVLCYSDSYVCYSGDVSIDSACVINRENEQKTVYCFELTEYIEDDKLCRARTATTRYHSWRSDLHNGGIGDWTKKELKKWLKANPYPEYPSRQTLNDEEIIAIWEYRQDRRKKD